MLQAFDTLSLTVTSTIVLGDTTTTVPGTLNGGAVALTPTASAPSC